MPSPFPGMDPYIEGQVWEDFHHGFIEAMREALTARLRPRYVVKVELRVYVEHVLDAVIDIIRPDVAVLPGDRTGIPSPASGVAVATAVEEVDLTLPLTEEKREAFITISTRDDSEVVAMIELLSPSNKRLNADGRREYLRQRESLIRTDIHLIELDLLRGGERLPTVEPLPPADCYAFVARGSRRPRVSVYPWTLRRRLPTIPIPLVAPDPDVPLDLQAVFTTVYDRAGYDYSLDYRRPVDPPLAEADTAWAAEIAGTLTAPRP